MARVFDGSTQWGTHAAGVRTAAPFSMACWFRPANVTHTGGLMSLTVVDDSTGFYLFMSNADIIARVQAGGAADDALISAVASASAWQHVCFTAASASSRAVYHNGGSKATSTASRTPAGINETAIGVTLAAFSLDPFNGRIARAAIWDVSLSDDDVAALYSNGMAVSPALVRPEALVAWWDLIGKYSPEIDSVGGFDMTLTASPTAADGPRLASRRRKANPFVDAGVVTATRGVPFGTRGTAFNGGRCLQGILR